MQQQKESGSTACLKEKHHTSGGGSATVAPRLEALAGPNSQGPAISLGNQRQHQLLVNIPFWFNEVIMTMTFKKTGRERNLVYELYRSSSEGVQFM